jgi:hypothetical protein
MTEAAVFVCTGVGEGAVIPDDVFNVHVSDTVERIEGIHAFQGRMVTKFRCPPLVTTIIPFMFDSRSSMFSLEVPEK